jgi:hypothetical protein
MQDGSLPFPAPWSLPAGTHLSGPSSPKSSPAPRPCVFTDEFPIAELSTHRFLLTLAPPPMRSHPRAVASPPHTVSCHVGGARYSAVPSLHDRDAHARSSMTKPHVACPTGRADSAKSVPSRPCVALAACTHSWVGAVRWHPPLCRVSCLSIDTCPPHHLQRLPDKPCVHCLHTTELQQPPPYAPTPTRVSTRCLSTVEC